MSSLPTNGWGWKFSGIWVVCICWGCCNLIKSAQYPLNFGISQHSTHGGNQQLVAASIICTVINYSVGNRLFTLRMTCTTTSAFHASENCLWPIFGAHHFTSPYNAKCSEQFISRRYLENSNTRIAVIFLVERLHFP